MTIAINLKVNDGVVLASDSATTLMSNQNGNQVATNVYDNANKIFNLRKGLPIGLMTWGSGSIGDASIATLAKDLRERLSGRSANHLGWRLESNYQLSDVAQRVRDFFYDELYTPAFRAWPSKPQLGFVVAGYSNPGSYAEEYLILMDEQGNCSGPTALRTPTTFGITWNGMTEPLTRLLMGFSAALPNLLPAAFPEQERPRVGAALAGIRPQLLIPLVQPAMPLQDAIDLAEYLAELTIKFSRFAPGASVVGGPVEIAAITRHEHFKWVKRKYYFDRALNPKEDLANE